MTMESVRLRTGERLDIQIITPPFPKYAPRLWCWSEIKDDLFARKLVSWLHTPYFIGEIGSELAGSMSCFTPADSREVGCVEFVLLEVCLAHFEHA